MEFTVLVHEGEDGSYWAEVPELPGCFASGDDFQELKEAVTEAVWMCLAPEDRQAENGDDSPALRVDEWKVAAGV